MKRIMTMFLGMLVSLMLPMMVTANSVGFTSLDTSPLIASISMKSASAFLVNADNRAESDHATLYKSTKNKFADTLADKHNVAERASTMTRYAVYSGVMWRSRDDVGWRKSVDSKLNPDILNL